MNEGKSYAHLLADCSVAKIGSALLLARDAAEPRVVAAGTDKGSLRAVADEAEAAVAERVDSIADGELNVRSLQV